MSQQPQRVGIFWVSRYTLHEFFQGIISQEAVAYQINYRMPTGAQLLDICYDFHRDCFGLKLWHPSFEPINLGDELPNLNHPGEPVLEAMPIRPEIASSQALGALTTAQRCGFCGRDAQILAEFGTGVAVFCSQECATRYVKAKTSAKAQLHAAADGDVQPDHITT